MDGDALSLVVGAVAALLGLPFAFLLFVASRRLTTAFLLGLFFVGILLAAIAAEDILFLVAWELAAIAAWGIGRLETWQRGESAFPLGSAGLFATTFLLAAVALSLPDVSALAEPGWVTALAITAGLLATAGVVSPIADHGSSGGFDAAPAFLVGPAALAIGLWPAIRLADGPAPLPLVVGLSALAAVSFLASLSRRSAWRRLADLAVGAQSACLAAVAVGGNQLSLLAVAVATGVALSLAALALLLGEATRVSGEHEVGALRGQIARSTVLAMAAAPAGLLFNFGLACLGPAAAPAALAPPGLAAAAGLLPALAGGVAVGRLLGDAFAGPVRARLVPRDSRLAAAGLALCALLAAAGLATASSVLAWIASIKG